MLQPLLVTGFYDGIYYRDIRINRVIRNGAYRVPASLVVFEGFVPFLQVLVFLAESVIKKDVAVGGLFRFPQYLFHLLYVMPVFRTLKSCQPVVVVLVGRIFLQQLLIHIASTFNLPDIDRTSRKIGLEKVDLRLQFNGLLV